MSTKIRPNIAKSNPYYISRHRFYELKHFCLQYPEWEKERIKYLTKIPGGKIEQTVSGTPSDPTSYRAIEAAGFAKRMRMVEDALMACDPELYSWLFKAVTKGIPFSALLGVYGIPCSRDTFYDRYRKFFYILSAMRDEFA